MIAGQVMINRPKMGKSTSQHKYVPNFVKTKPGKWVGFLNSVNDGSYNVKNAAYRYPQDEIGGEILIQVGENYHHNSAHGDKNRNGKPAGSIQPDGFFENTDRGNYPNADQQVPACRVFKPDGSHRRICTRNHHKNHHMIDAVQLTNHFFRTGVHMKKSTG